MISIENYLDALEKELHGSDSATIRDAKSDAEEYLRSAVENMKEQNPELSYSEVVKICIEEYGAPEEIASAYKQVEEYLVPSYSPLKMREQSSFWVSTFGIVADPRAWGSLLYMLLALITGIIYFSWAVTGISLSVGLSILIFGLPVAIIFLLSVKGISFLEGRLVEGLLGVQMPRRMSFTHPGMKFIDRLKHLTSDRYTWLSILYMILQLPLGIIYFTVIVTLISLVFGVFAIPVVQALFKYPTIYIGTIHYYFPTWSYPLLIAGGIVVFLVTMHLAKIIGSIHGKFAKIMMVGN